MTLLTFDWPDEGTVRAPGDGMTPPWRSGRWGMVGVMVFLVVVLWALTTYPAAANCQASGASSAVELFVGIGNAKCDDANPVTEQEPLCNPQEGADRAVPGTSVSVRTVELPPTAVTLGVDFQELPRFEVRGDRHHPAPEHPVLCRSPGSPKWDPLLSTPAVARVVDDVQRPPAPTAPSRI